MSTTTTLAATIEARPLAYSVPDAAKAITVSVSTLHRLINDGALATCKVSGRTVIRTVELERYLAANETRKPVKKD